MTKYMLYPPLETESESSEDSNMLLSEELKRSFETVRNIHQAQSRVNASLDNEKNDVTEKEDLEARKFEAAVAAAVAAESEISALAKGINELENLLLRQESTENCGSDKFPNLPSKIETETHNVEKDE